MHALYRYGSGDAAYAWWCGSGFNLEWHNAMATTIWFWQHCLGAACVCSGGVTLPGGNLVDGGHGDGHRGGGSEDVLGVSTR